MEEFLGTPAILKGEQELIKITIRKIKAVFFIGIYLSYFNISPIIRNKIPSLL